MTPTPIARLTIEHLSRLESPKADVISCYLRLDSAARFRKRFLVEVKRRARDLERQLAARDEEGSVRESVAADLERLVSWLASSDPLLYH